MNYGVALVIGALCALWGYNVGKNRKIGSTAGALLGFFLGLIGIIIVYCSSRVYTEPPIYTDPTPGPPSE